VTHVRFDCQDPFWSPDGTRLYYLSRARDRDGLWSISVSGGAPELVMENVSRAALSPDGKTLAFFQDVAEGQLKLWLSSPPGSSPAPYARPPFVTSTGYVQATVHFSPDGSKLGVWTEGGGGTRLDAKFWVLPMGNGAPYVAASPVADLAGLAPTFSWLPDSRRVLSALPHPRPGMHIWLMDTERGDSRLLMATGAFESDPAVSPDGTRLALSFQQADYDLYQLSVDHPSPSAVLATSRNEMDPAWSPSGVMAFTTDRNGHDEIWLRSQKGDFERPLVTPADFGASQTDLLSAPAFSPDGLRIAYSRAGSDGYQIWITPLGGGPPSQLSRGPTTGAQDWPSWSRDGVWVGYAHTSQGKWALAKMRVGARTPEVVVSDIVPFSPVQWAPDGNWIAYNGLGGLSVVSPDGQSTRVLHEQTWMAFTWSADSRQVFGIRQSDDLKHLTFTSVDIGSGTEHVLGPDIMPAPVAGQPVRGITRASPTTFIASIVHVRSDVWLLDGFQSSPTLWDRLTSAVLFRNR
jgi:Tol biopolymer transport system component